MEKTWLGTVPNCILILMMSFLITACGNVEKDTTDEDYETNSSELESEEISEEQKGSILNPYSLGDSFEITAYEVVPYSAYTPQGRQVENPITFKISNIQVLDQQIYTYTPYGESEGEDHDNYYLVAFELEVLDSSVSETIIFNLDYLKLLNLNTNGQEGNMVLGSDAYIPDDYIYFDWQVLMPLKGAAWNFADVVQTKDDRELAYIMFHYCGDDGEYHSIYVDVKTGENIGEKENSDDTISEE